MWEIPAFSIFFLFAGFSSAQNPYALKRPSYCSTCFTNDQHQNYYCCFYFFRCCAESRLGSNNRKISTPSPEYPDLSSTLQTLTTKETLLEPPSETKCKKCAPGDLMTDESRRTGSPSPCRVEDCAPTGTNRKDSTSDVTVSRPSEKIPAEHSDNSRQRNTNNFPDPGARETPVPSYSSAYGGRRYPYNVPRVYPVQQPARNMENRYGGDLSGPSWSKTKYSEMTEKISDSTGGRVQQSAKLDAVQSADDVFWGRMEPVKENAPETT